MFSKLRNCEDFAMRCHRVVVFPLPPCRIMNFIMREQTGALAPPSYDEHKARHSRKGGIMATVFSGKHHSPDVALELSLEMNRKMRIGRHFSKEYHTKSK